MNKAIFLDRDGTIAKDVRYCSRPEDFVFLPTVFDGLKLLSKTEFKIIVVTNQSGIARGYFTEEILSRIHAKMKAEITEHGGRIDVIYYCPHHPDDKCQCRKPNTGMLKNAANEWEIDLSGSYFIGDKYLDMEAANKVDCKAVLVPREEPELGELYGKKGCKGSLDFVSPDFMIAAKWVLADAIKMTQVAMVVPPRKHNLTPGSCLSQDFK